MSALPQSMLITARDAWALCGLSRAAWYKANAAGKVPRPVKIGGATRWRRDELVRWIEAGCPSRNRWDTINSTK